MPRHDYIPLKHVLPQGYVGQECPRNPEEPKQVQASRRSMGVSQEDR
jgi:hypothetical protein